MAVWAVLVAAGVGERLGGDRPKAFAVLAGRPLLAESLERLESSDWVDAIVVVVPPGWEEPSILLAEELAAVKVAGVVPGGRTRAESVKAGVDNVGSDALVILVHDAARPLLDDAVLERVLAPLAEGWDGVVPALRIADTVKRVEGVRVLETVDRSELVAVQTPQAFVAEVIRAALDGELADATDCAALVERCNGRVCVVEGDPRLRKVTTRADLDDVGRLLSSGPA